MISTKSYESTKWKSGYTDIPVVTHVASEKILLDTTALITKCIGRIFLITNLWGRLWSVDDVRGDREGEVYDVVVELIGESILSLNVQSWRRRQVLHHRLDRQLEEEPSQIIFF